MLNSEAITLRTTPSRSTTNVTRLANGSKTPQALHSEGGGERLVGVGHQREVELQRLREGLVRLHSFETYPEDLGSRRGNIGLPVPEGARLLGSAGREVLRIEVDDVRRAAEPRARELAAVV